MGGTIGGFSVNELETDDTTVVVVDVVTVVYTVLDTLPFMVEVDGTEVT